MDLEQMLRDGRVVMATSGPSPSRPRLSTAMSAQDLQDGLTALTVTHCFSPGMIVRQKRSCTMYRDLSEDGLAIVVEVLEAPLRCPASDSSNPHFNEPL